MWVALMELGFIGYVISLILLIVKGISPDGTFRRGSAAKWAGLAAVSFGLWLVALSKA